MNKATNEHLKKLHLMHQLEAQKQGLQFHPAELKATQATGPYFASNMWNDHVKPGEWMRYYSHIGNAGTGAGSELVITTFFGPGCLYANPADGIATRDQAWPMLNSATFAAPPQQEVRVEMGHRLPVNIAPGHYVLNLLLWRQGLWNQPAIWCDRMHIRFEVIA